MLKCPSPRNPGKAGVFGASLGFGIGPFFGALTLSLELFPGFNPLKRSTEGAVNPRANGRLPWAVIFETLTPC